MAEVAPAAGDGPRPRDADEAAQVEAAVAEVQDRMSAIAGHIRTAVRSAAAAVDPALQPFGLKLLRLVENNGPMSPSAAADRLAVDRSVVSRQIRQLTDLGLARLVTDPADGRARLMELTPEGARRLKDIVPDGPLDMHSVLSTWSADDLHRFAGYITRIIDARSAVRPRRGQ
ncbi:MarR family winged helix-turn-helix transcriptional regulator [Mycetocola reblochoni]|uniref:Transcriptional regulator, MarR family n=2 Tax=Mycetocola reblochoni TaxID=331618 RepID=A0A1R4IRW7_9MICO|nr:MarR family transcriptional regulator [Mycetocola reblochoni]RLP71147.1 MarR family transcriptional regulator [Mycetocola reblochoni]SJN22640.1 Transcriptional regulator, MarR family [Mycetocola reblochoni REB411]